MCDGINDPAGPRRCPSQRGERRREYRRAMYAAQNAAAITDPTGPDPDDPVGSGSASPLRAAPSTTHTRRTPQTPARAYGISVEDVSSAWDRTRSGRATGTRISGTRASAWERPGTDGDDEEAAAEIAVSRRMGRPSKGPRS